MIMTEFKICTIAKLVFESGVAYHKNMKPLTHVMFDVCNIVNHAKIMCKVNKQVISCFSKGPLTIPYFTQEDFDFEYESSIKEKSKIATIVTRSTKLSFAGSVYLVQHIFSNKINIDLIKNDIVNKDNTLFEVIEDPHAIKTAFAFPCPDTHFYNTLPLVRLYRYIDEKNIIQVVNDNVDRNSDNDISINISSDSDRSSDSDDDDDIYSGYFSWFTYIENYLMRYRH